MISAWHLIWIVPAAATFGFALAVLLDGGHVAAINGSEEYAKINLKQKQYYAIQGE